MPKAPEKKLVAKKTASKKRAAPKKPAAKTSAAKKPAKRGGTKTASAKTKPSRAEWPRDPALEQAIIDAPLDPVPRMVYADWLQGAGDRRGEWMALNAAIEAEPKNVRLRSAAVDFLGQHRELLLGPGKALLVGGWIGWRAGFIDEIRVQPVDAGTVKAFASLLAHPSSRFVRTVGMGDLGQAGVDALVAAAPPLLETVVVIDASWNTNSQLDLEGLARLRTIRRLGLYGAMTMTPMPQLRELSTRADGSARPWLTRGGCENLERLTVDCESHGDVRELLRRVPKLKQLRLLELGDGSDLDAVMGLHELELVDLSYGQLRDADVERFVGWRNLRLVLHRTPVSTAMLTKLAGSGVEVISSRASEQLDSDHEPGSWWHYRLTTDGRDGIATMPGVGYALYNIGTNHSLHGDPAEATVLLDAALTFPSAGLKTWAWANAAIAHERRFEFDDAELIAREGLLRTPKEPNLFAIVVDALRRTGRLKEALALIPRSLAAIEAAPGAGAHSGGRPACLADVLYVHAQAGNHEQVIELADKYKELVKLRKDIYAIVAMSLVALGKLKKARKLSLDAEDSRFPAVVAHCSAVVALADDDVETALVHLREAKELAYPEWHWIAVDPNLAKLHGNAEFQALVS